MMWMIILQDLKKSLVFSTFCKDSNGESPTSDMVLLIGSFLDSS